MTALLLAGAAWPASAPAAPPRALPTILQDDALLLHRPPAEVAASMRRLRALGVDLVRISAVWSSLAPAPDAETRPAFDAADPAAYEQLRWKGLDTAVREAAAAGLPVLIDIGLWAPAWAARDTGPRARTDVDAGAFAEFSEAVVRRYSGTFVPPAPPGSAPPPEEEPGPDPELPPAPSPSDPPAPAPPTARGEADTAATPLPRVGTFALWNEPNHQAFLFPTWERAGRGWLPASPHRYRSMVALGYARTKAVRPDATMLVGNTSSTGKTGGRAPVPPLRFVRELACVDRSLRPLRRPACQGFRTVPGDGWAHHPYAPASNPGRRSRPHERDFAYLGDLPRMRRLLDALVRRGRLAPRLRDLWITELGWETPGGGAPATVSEAAQARYLAWAEYSASRSGARTFAQFLLRDVPPLASVTTSSARRRNGQFATGIERADGTPKKAAHAFRVNLFVLRRTRKTVRLWARLRMSDAAVGLRFEREDRSTRRWRRIAGMGVPGRGAFTRDVPHLPGTRYRIVVFDSTGATYGLPVSPVSRG